MSEAGSFIFLYRLAVPTYCLLFSAIEAGEALIRLNSQVTMRSDRRSHKRKREKLEKVPNINHICGCS